MLADFVAVFEGFDDHVTVDDDGVGLHQRLFCRVANFLEILIGFERDNTNLLGNGSSSGRLVASDHDDLDTCGLALLDGEGHRFLGGVHQRDQTHEDEVFHGEVEVVGRGGVEAEALGVLLLVEG